MTSVASSFRAWGISEEVIRTFEEKKITIDLLQYLSPERLTELIPTEGDQLRFGLNYQQVLTNINKKSDIVQVNAETDHNATLVFSGNDFEQFLNSTTSTDLSSIVVLPLSDVPQSENVLTKQAAIGAVTEWPADLALESTQKQSTAHTIVEKETTAAAVTTTTAATSTITASATTTTASATITTASATTTTATVTIDASAQIINSTAAISRGSETAVSTAGTVRSHPNTSGAIPRSLETPTAVPGCSKTSAAGGCPFTGAPIDLHAILVVQERGQVILATYQQNKSLNQASRDSLAHLVIVHELGKDLNGRISPERFDYYATKIVELFPTENTAAWIVFDSHKRCLTGKGKLYVCWYGLCRKWQLLGLIPRGRKGRQGTKRGAEFIEEDDPLEDSPEAVDAVQWLKNSSKPWVTVEKHWKDTHSIRRRRILYENVQVIETLNEFPSLKDNRGYTLLEIDFDNIYPDSALKLFAAWPTLCDFFVKKIRERKKSFATNVLTSDGKTALVLSSISQAFSVVTARKQKQAIKEWRPSRSEAQDAFVLHIETIASLDTKLNEHRDRLVSFGCHMQPVAVLIGPHEKISQCFVVLDDNFKYEVETPLKALDITFKCFHSLHANYPTEASQIWQFFQRAMYGMPRKAQYDPYFNGLETLIQDYKNSLQ